VKRAAAIALLAATGCVSEPPPVAPSPTQAEWERAHEELERLRARSPRVPHTERVAVTVHAFGHVLEGRGALAILPGEALRMIVVGAAGATAFDLWMGKDAWRVEVPAAGLVRRGTSRDPAPGLPTGFFRSWFIDPLGGRLLAAADRTLFVRDRAGGTWALDVERGTTLRVTATRKAGERTQSLEFEGAPAAPRAGDRARWSDPSAKLVVEIVVEEVGLDPPDPDAFVEPRGPS
jgi:hypothetical protein